MDRSERDQLSRMVERASPQTLVTIVGLLNRELHMDVTRCPADKDDIVELDTSHWSNQLLWSLWKCVVCAEPTELASSS